MLYIMYKKKPYTTKNRKYKIAGKTLATKVKTIARRLEQPLHKLHTGEFTRAYQRQVYTLGLTTNIPQGDSDLQRTSDTIYLEGLKYRFIFHNSQAVYPDRTSWYRVMVVKTDQDFQGGSNAFSATALTALDIFHQATDPALEHVNSKRCTVLMDKTVKISPQITGTITQNMISGFLPIKQKFVYKTGSNFGKFHNYYVVVTPWQEGATTLLDTVGWCTFYGDLIFKNSQ